LNLPNLISPFKLLKTFFIEGNIETGAVLLVIVAQISPRKNLTELLRPTFAYQFSIGSF